MAQVRSVLAGLEGVDDDDVDVDFGAKTATVDLSDSKCTADDVVAAFEDTRFSVAVK